MVEIAGMASTWQLIGKLFRSSGNGQVLDAVTESARDVSSDMTATGADGVLGRGSEREADDPDASGAGRPHRSRDGLAEIVAAHSPDLSPSSAQVLGTTGEKLRAARSTMRSSPFRGEHMETVLTQAPPARWSCAARDSEGAKPSGCGGRAAEAAGPAGLIEGHARRGQ